jgi:hypothetical protein
MVSRLEQVALGVLGDRRVVGAVGVDRGVHQRLERQGGAVVAGVLGDDRSEVAAGAVAAHHQAGGVDIERRNIVGHPSGGGDAVLDTRWEGVFGGQAVVDRHHHRARLGGEETTDGVMGGDGAHDEAAAVEEHHAR